MSLPKSGHAPSYLREALQEWLNEFGLKLPDDIDAAVEVGTEERTGRWLIGRLWNCTDCLPSIYCQLLRIPQGSSYAIGVRYLKQRLTD